MTRDEAFLAIPTDALVVGYQAPDATISDTNLGHHAVQVPAICEVLQQGYTDIDVHRMREAHRARTEKELGEACRIRFWTSPMAKPLRPDFVDGVGIRVVGGAEHAVAAVARGIAYVPVHLTSDETTRRAVTPQGEHEVGQIALGVVDLHRIYDSRFRDMREGTQAPELGRRNGERHAIDRPWARPARPMRLEREG